jgi:hypothetical protein
MTDTTLGSEDLRPCKAWTASEQKSKREQEEFLKRKKGLETGGFNVPLLLAYESQYTTYDWYW